MGGKTDKTGPSGSKHGILFIFDIFGFYPQTLQGADILAYGNSERPYSVFMPDWFEGKPADISWYPPDTPEKGEKLGNFFSTTAAPPKTAKKVLSLIEVLKKENPEIQSWVC